MLTRRSLLASPLLVASAASPARIRIAFLGGSHSHALPKFQVVQKSPHYELAGVCEADPKLRAQYESAGARILTRDQLLGDPAIQAVAVESDVPSHGKDGIAVLAAGKHLHLEKPPAANLADLRRQVELARQKKLVLQMGYMWRHNPAVNEALAMARAGQLGDIYQVRACMNTLVEGDRRKEWDLFKGGQMYEQGAHLIDIMVRLLGKPAGVSSTLRRDGKFPDQMKDNTVAVLEWQSALGIVMSSTLQPRANPHRFLEILGSKGTAVIRPIEPPTLLVDLEGKPEPKRFSYTRYIDDFEEFAGLIRGEKQPAVTFEQELAIQETILRASKMGG